MAIATPTAGKPYGAYTGPNGSYAGPAGGAPGMVIPGAGTALPGGSVSASSAHKMLIAVAFELAFVVVATMLAGISDTWGSGMVALMVALLVLRGLFQVNIFGNFVQNNQFLPSPSTSSASTPATQPLGIVV